MSIEDDVMDCLQDGCVTIKEIVSKTKWTYNGIYGALAQLKKNGEVRYNISRSGKVKTCHWFVVENPPEPDFTPNLPYKGPSYTYFLQGIWNDARPTASL